MELQRLAVLVPQRVQVQEPQQVLLLVQRLLLEQVQALVLLLEQAPQPQRTCRLEGSRQGTLQVLSLIHI